MSTLADIYSYSNSGFPAYVSPTAPIDPPNHNIWFNPDTGDLSVWNGSEWVVVSCDCEGCTGGGEGSPYPAPTSFLRCTYEGAEGQTIFTGVDIFGVTLAGLTEAGTISAIHVNGVRIQDNEYTVSGDGEITLSRPVAAGSSVIVEAFGIADGGGSGGAPYPAPGAYLRCTYAATFDGQTLFNGTDKFGNELSNLTAPGAIAIVHVNGVRLEDDEYAVISDGELSLARGVMTGSSVIVEIMEVAEGSGWGAPPVLPATAYKIETERWTFDGVQSSFSIYVNGSLYAPESANGIFLSLEGVILDPGVDFTVSGYLLVFTFAPPPDAMCWGIIGIPNTAGVPEHNHDCGVF